MNESADAAIVAGLEKVRASYRTAFAEATSEQALREARSFLGIQENDRDEAGDRWTMW